MTPLGQSLRPLGVGDQTQLLGDLPQPGWVQAPGPLGQDRVGGQLGVLGSWRVPSATT
jgi:hypothetical protein